MPSWYREGEVRSLVLEYYYVLRSVLRDRADLRRSLTHCVHCGIFFITDPRNAGRDDLRCPFGCREAHCKQSSTERSVAYYRTEEGKLKKQLQNGKRRRARSASECDIGSSEKKKQAEEVLSLRHGGSSFDEGIVLYLMMVTSLIEGRSVSLEEVLEMLLRVVRQHSMARRRRADYLVWHLKSNPP